jgi:hypothetical protein
VLSPHVKRYIATDQDYVLKLLKENLAENRDVFATSAHKSGKKKGKGEEMASNIDARTLDWEKDDQANLYNELSISQGESIDALIACDCIYNTHLINPLVNTCAEICQLAPSSRPTVVVVAQQLRSSDVFEAWLVAFHERFRVWKMPDDVLDKGLKEGGGFVVHMGILRDSSDNGKR